MSAAVPWRWSVRRRTLIVSFDREFRTLGWAPLGAGFVRTRAVANHQVLIDDRRATEAPRAHLTRLMRDLAPGISRPVAMMTGADVARAAYATRAAKQLAVAVWCTAGCSNALRVGDRATAKHPGPGTINMIVAVNQPMSRAAMAEAIQIAVEARVVAVQNAGIASTRSGAPATGTGTDCLVIAAPATTRGHLYCGKHTHLGELIGRAALASCTRALARCAT